MRVIFLSLCVSFVALLAGCEQKPEETAPSPAPPRDSIVAMPLEGARGREFNPANIEGFHDVVFEQYKRMALALPKKTLDSIMVSTPPPEIQNAMQPHLNRQDRVARMELASKYGIGLDSINRILQHKGVPAR